MALASFANAKSWTGLSTFDGTLGAALATDADNEFRDLTGLYIYAASGGSPLPVVEYHDGGGDFVQLHQTPVVAITSIKTVDTSLAELTTIASTSYAFYAESGLVIFRQGDATLLPTDLFPAGEKSLKVTYTVGLIDSDFKATMAINAATYLLAAKLMEVQNMAEWTKINGASSLALDSLSRNVTQEGPYSFKIGFYRRKAQEIIDRLRVRGWVERI